MLYRKLAVSTTLAWIIICYLCLISGSFFSFCSRTTGWEREESV